MTHVNALRWLDHWIGIPACWFLTAWRRLTDFAGRAPNGPPRAIVFIKLVEQGSTVLAYAALCRAIERVGKKNVYFLVFEENRYILDALDLIEPGNVLAIRSRKPLTAFADIARALTMLRSKQVDSAIDLEFFARGSAILSYLSGCQTRVGLHGNAGEAPYRGDLMTHRVRYNPYLHTTETFRLLVEALDQSSGALLPFPVTTPERDEQAPMVVPRESELTEVSGLIRAALPGGRCASLILLNPNCSDMLPLRRWPEKNYVELARLLLARYPNAHVAITGAPSERIAGEAFASQVGSERCFSLAGWTTLRQLLVLYTTAEVLVTNDSGPAQFATLTPIDVVTLFGPETPKLFAARSPRNHVFWQGLACSPCVSAANQRLSSCRDNLCMQQIHVDAVFQKVCEIYDCRATANRAISLDLSYRRRAGGLR